MKFRVRTWLSALGAGLHAARALVPSAAPLMLLSPPRLLHHRQRSPSGVSRCSTASFPRWSGLGSGPTSSFPKRTSASLCRRRCGPALRYNAFLCLHLLQGCVRLTLGPPLPAQDTQGAQLVVMIQAGVLWVPGSLVLESRHQASALPASPAQLRLHVACLAVPGIDRRTSMVHRRTSSRRRWTSSSWARCFRARSSTRQSRCRSSSRCSRSRPPLQVRQPRR